MADLLYLIGLCLAALWLEVQDFLHPVLPEAGSAELVCDSAAVRQFPRIRAAEFKNNSALPAQKYTSGFSIIKRRLSKRPSKVTYVASALRAVPVLNRGLVT